MEFWHHRLRDEPQYRDMGRPKGTRKGVINLIPGLRFRDKVREGLRTIPAPMTVQEIKTGDLKVSVLSHKSVTSK